MLMQMMSNGGIGSDISNTGERFQGI